MYLYAHHMDDAHQVIVFILVCFLCVFFLKNINTLNPKYMRLEQSKYDPTHLTRPFNPFPKWVGSTYLVKYHKRVNLFMTLL